MCLWHIYIFHSLKVVILFFLSEPTSISPTQSGIYSWSQWVSQRDSTQVEHIAIYNQNNKEGVAKQSHTGAVPQGGRIFTTIATTALHHHGKSRGQRRSCCLHGLSECEALEVHVVHYSRGFSYSLDVTLSNLVPLV